MTFTKELFDKLPPELKKEVENYIEFLLNQRAKKPGKKLSQCWAEGLKEFKDQFTSLELQKKTLEWRGD